MGLIDFVLDTIAEFNPGKSKINRDLGQIDAELVDYKQQLVDLSDKELAEISNYRSDSERSRRTKISKALIATIFEEPALCYGFKDYKGKGRNGVALVYTRNREFIFRFREKNVTVFLNRQLVGFLNHHGQISKGKSNRVLAEIDTAGTMRAIHVEGREVASFNYENAESSKVKKRVVNYIKTINPIERDMVIAFYALHIINQYEL